MFNSFLIHDAVIVSPAQGVNSVGDPVPDWDAAVRVDSKVWVESVQAGEDTDLRDLSSGRFRLFFDPSAVVKHEDRVEVNGVVYEIVGPPLQRYAVRGLHHLEMQAFVVVG